MSDDEEVVFTKKLKLVHYGSLDENERQRQLTVETAVDTKIESDDVPGEAPVAGHINISDEYMEMEVSTTKEKQMLLEGFERRKKARQINVSTDDIEVKASLRQLDEPICMFGEGPAERRERLRQLYARLGDDPYRHRKPPAAQDTRMDKERDSNLTWYHQGTEALRQSRIWIAEHSLKNAKKRLEDTRNYMKIPDPEKNARRQEIYKKLRTLSISSSQIGDVRPVSFCQFSPNSEYLATGSFSGLCKLWSVPDCKLIRTYDGHNKCIIGAIIFRPQATLSLSEKECNMASCASDGSVKLWDMVSDKPVGELVGHTERVSRLAFHPSGNYIATCVHDNSWRFWDLETRTELIHQEGHSKPVFDISFQCDGSLAATGGQDAFGRVWDLRTGRCIMFMEGHLKAVLSICFSPNGYQLATGSEDNTIKIWDLRYQKCEYTIPGHTGLISRVVFEKTYGQFMATSSYDNTLRIWSHPGWTNLQTLSGHDGKVMCCDISTDGKTIATCSYDRTFKLWTPESS